MIAITEKSYLILVIIFTIEFCKIEALKTKYVTCGSLIKLLNSDYGYRLHSHDVKYGSGSGQQSVTGIDIQEDVNSHWQIKGKTNNVCDRGEPIRCGDTIRLEHLSTKRNLHSHYFSSPLTNEQEISCYGNDGLGDTGDHWELICSGENWDRLDHVQFRHVDTGVYLGLSGRTFGRPISGQMEVVGVNSPQTGTKWAPAEGLFIVPKDIKEPYRHTEL